LRRPIFNLEAVWLFTAADVGGDVGENGTEIGLSLAEASGTRGEAAGEETNEVVEAGDEGGDELLGEPETSATLGDVGDKLEDLEP